MTKKSHTIWLMSAFLLFGALSIVTATKLKCDGDDAPVDCLLFQYYQELNDELSCELCAVAIELGKYPEKTDKFCNNPDGTVRKCEIISFTYLLTTQRFSQAFDLQYEIFYRDPFGHDQRVSSILKKQHIRSQIIAWLEKNMDDQKAETFLARAIANLYLDDINESDAQLQHYFALKGGIFDKQTIKLKCRIFEKQGQFNEAFNILDKYIKEGESDQRNYHMIEPYLYHLKGNLLMHHLKFNEAIVEFTKASNTFKSFYQEREFLRGFKFSQFNIGLCYQKMSKHQQAVNKYIELVKNNVKTVEVLNALGNAFIELAVQEKPDKLDCDEQKIQRAVFYLSRAIEENSNYYLAHYNLGYAYMKCGDYNLAIEKFRDSLGIHKSSQASYALLTTYFLFGKYEEAQNLITKNITVDEENIDDLLSICYEYCNLKRNPKFYHKVLTEYQKFIKSANGHYWKAMIEFDREQYGLAIDHFLQAYDKGYNEPHLLFNLAYAYELIDDHQSACNYYEKAYLKDPREETKEKIHQCKSKIKASTQKQKQNNQEL